MDSSGGGKRVWNSVATDGTISTGGLGSEPTESHDASELLAGMMVGEYQIEGPLGEGGMGRVYAAVHPVIAKRAAIKVLHPELSMNKEAVDRFVQEARSVNQIGHPNIVDIFAFGKLPDGRNYFVMEWLRGESLRDRVKRQPLSIVDAMHVIETITLPLEAAHEKGIVHRDLKPDNIFLVDIRGDRPQIKLLDFGIAKLMGTQGLQRTQTGNMLGTPAYISPEQARAEGVDHRTDIYALGAVLFELLTGKMAFDATNAADMIAKHLYEPPRSATRLNPNVPPQLDALIVRMLAKSAADRPTLEQVRAELRACRGAMGVLTPSHGMQMSGVGMAVPHTPPHGVQFTPPLRTQSSGPVAAPALTGVAPRTPRRSRVPVILVSLVLALALGAGVFIAMNQQEPAATANETAPTPVETSPVETKPMEAVAPVEPKPPEPTPAEAKPDQPKPVEPAGSATETKPVEAKPVETKQTTATKTTKTTKPTDKKRRRRNTTTKQGSGATVPFDPDAPM